jgi:ribose/xylose/arabinose/galactoside ABC-type transport system permease subunit
MSANQPGLLARIGIRGNEIALVLAICLIVGLTLMVDRNRSYYYESGTNAVEIARQTSLLGIFALGAMMVIISGGIDLSAGSMIAFSGTVIACTMIFLQKGPFAALVPEWLAVTLGIGAGLFSGFLVGTLHAWLVTSIRLPPFVATLSTLVGLRSLARILCEFVTKTYEGGKKAQVPIDQAFYGWLRNPDNIWVWVAVFLVLAAMTWLILRWTVLGRHIYAMGGNEQAARLSGIRTDKLKWFAYVFGAMTASLAGVFYIANEGVSAPVNQGRGHELNAIAAAVVGGCSLQGGIGTVSGTILGALFLRVVIDAVAKIIKTGADIWEGLIVGVVVVLAVTFSQLHQLRGSGRRLFPGAMGVWAMFVLALTAGLVAISTKGFTQAVITIAVVLVLLLGYGWTEKRKSTG